MKTKCPQCDTSLRVSRPEQLGKKIKCPRCLIAVRVPSDLQLDVKEIKNYKKVRCNGCLTKIRVKRELIGQSIQCPMCDKRFRIPYRRPEPVIVASVVVEESVIETDRIKESSSTSIISTTVETSTSEFAHPSDDNNAAPDSGQGPNNVESDIDIESNVEDWESDDDDVVDAILVDAPDEVENEPVSPDKLYKKETRQKSSILAYLAVGLFFLVIFSCVGAYIHVSRGGNLDFIFGASSEEVSDPDDPFEN